MAESAKRTQDSNGLHNLRLQVVKIVLSLQNLGRFQPPTRLRLPKKA
jgi:hypothetical protein